MSRKLASTGAFRLPLDTRPMEAKAADHLPSDDGKWQYEPKWDGFRCLAFKEGDSVELRAKSGKPLGRYFPELLSLLRMLPAACFVIDGEMVIEVDGKPSFDALQMRLHPAESRIRKLSLETPAKLIIFDMLVDARGEIITEQPLVDRRAAVETFVKDSDRDEIMLSPSTRDLGEARSLAKQRWTWGYRRCRRQVAWRRLPSWRTRDGQGQAVAHRRLRRGWISVSGRQP